MLRHGMDLGTREGRREQGTRIQEAVERSGLSVEELARRIGCSRALIYQYLSGSTLAQPDRLQQIAQECAVPLSFFYTDGPPDDATAATPGRSRVGKKAVAAAALADERTLERLKSLELLAQAQASPPDYRTLAGTCERIVSLAAQLGDSAARARAQQQLGNALVTTADYSRAVDALVEAVDLARQAGDPEMEAAARQSLGKALSATGRVHEARAQFERVATGPSVKARWQGTLSLGVMHTLGGEYKEAMTCFEEAATILEEAERSGALPQADVATGLLYVNASRASVYMDCGDFLNARGMAERCAADAEALGVIEQHLEARFDVAWCDFCLGAWGSAHKGFSGIIPLARFAGDRGRETLARAWLAILLAAAGDHDGAAELGKDALATALSRGDRRGELYAQLALADAYMGLGTRESEARYHTNQAVAVATALRLDRAEAECRLRQARLAAFANDIADARELASRALSLAERLGARHLEALARCWLAETHEAVTTGEPGPVPRSTRRQADPRATSTSDSDPLTESTRALDLSRELGLAEGVWRACAVHARILAQSTDRVTDAEKAIREAVQALELLRLSLRDAGLPDTLLENAECSNIYGRMARLLMETGRSAEAATLLEQTAWPPLTEWAAQTQAS